MSTVAVDRIPLGELLGVTERSTGTHASAHRLVEHLNDQEPVLPFDAWRRESTGEYWPIVVTALMERTAAFHALGDRYDTGVLRLDLVLVEAESLQWKPKATPHTGWPGSHFRTYKTTAASPETQRAISDRRAIADQAVKRQEAEREESLRRASVATTAEGKEPMSEATRTCRVCGKEKPKDEFPAFGKNSRRCLDCAGAALGLGKPLPIKRSVKAKAAKKPRAIPAESKPAVVTLASGSGSTVDDALVNLVKNLVAERNALRAQLDAIEAALVHA